MKRQPVIAELLKAYRDSGNYIVAQNNFHLMEQNEFLRKEIYNLQNTIPLVPGRGHAGFTPFVDRVMVYVDKRTKP